MSASNDLRAIRQAIVSNRGLTPLSECLDGRFAEGGCAEGRSAEARTRRAAARKGLERVS